MNTHELMIGNLFLEFYSGEIIEVRGITKKNITFSGRFKGDWRAEPIKLTEEWINRSGLTKVDFGTSVMIYGHQFLIESIKYVHNLQNIHQAISGKDLKFK